MTTRIHRLPDDLVNKIAAGEVVERPASVVKELVENALDAGARSVQVDVEGGGRALVRVRDDGSGMSRADAELALERHATSKLSSLTDLDAIATRGFRGEALPSIASVCHLTLRTREEPSAAGTEIQVEHGRLVGISDVGHPRGTTVEARDLFGAVPARRKFLRAESTETGHAAEVLALLALSQPGTGFVLRSGPRHIVEAPPVEDLRARVYQLFGGRLLESLVDVEGGEEWARVRGLVSRPDAARAARTSLRLFVNGRPVRDRSLVRAVTEAYRLAGASDRGVEAFVFVDVPPSLVDVNVHPAKAEVRFADPRTVWVAVERAIRGALTAGTRTPPRAITSRSAEPVQAYFLREQTSVREDYGVVPARVSGAEATGPTDLVARDGAAPFEVSGSDDSARLAEPVVLGQHRQTYIVCSDGEELILVDQHTAHERARFEQIIRALEGRSVQVQSLLVPAVIELAPELRVMADQHSDLLGSLGFEVEAFGGSSMRLRTVPAVLGTRDPGPALQRLLRDFLEREPGAWIVPTPRERLAATVACHSSVRAGQGLNRETMVAIVRDLLLTDHPTLCPHGRPTVIRIPREDVTRWFGRTGWRRQ